MTDTAQTPPAPQPCSVRNWSGPAIFFILLLGCLYVARGMIVPIVSAVFIALIFSPVRRRLNSIGFSSVAAALVIFTLLIASLAGLTWLVSASLSNEFRDAPKLIESLTEKVQSLFAPLQPMLETAGAPPPESPESRDPFAALLERSGFVSAVSDSATGALGQIALCLTLVFFLIASGDLFYEKLVQVMPTLHDKKKALSIARGIEQQLSTYLFTITVINAAVGALITGAMWALGMPQPILFGLTAFVLNYIPYIGSLAGVALTFLVAVMTFSSLPGILLPVFAYWLIHTIEGQFVTPVLVGRRLKLNAVVVFLSFAVWTWLWSLTGMLLATPILLTLKVVSDHVPGLAGLGHFLADRDELSSANQRIIRFVFRRQPPVRDEAPAAEVPLASKQPEAEGSLPAQGMRSA